MAKSIFCKNCKKVVELIESIETSVDSTTTKIVCPNCNNTTKVIKRNVHYGSDRRN